MKNTLFNCKDNASHFVNLIVYKLIKLVLYTNWYSVPGRVVNLSEGPLNLLKLS